MIPTAVSLLLSLCGAPETLPGLEELRPPAVPLVTSDPYTSVWSFTDSLYDTWPAHWTGAVHAMAGMAHVDGKAMRFMGPEAVCAETMRQTKRVVYPTRTVYSFEGGGVELTVTFMTPMLPDDLKWLSAPFTFISYSARSVDGKEHQVDVYFDASAEWVVNEAGQSVVWERMAGPAETTMLRLGSQEQPVLAKSGDDIRIDWGYLYVVYPNDAAGVIAGADGVRGAFRNGTTLPATDDTRQPRAANDDWPVAACVLPLGTVGAEPTEKHILLAYDDLYSIEYMHERLRPWWYREFGSIDMAVAAALEEYPALRERCAALDAELLADADRIGGDEYACLLSMSYRHVFASGKIVEGPDGEPWYFHKECFSNGCTGTVDVSYPASPFFALFSPVLLKGMLEPVFDFARSDEWEWDFAPHDVGQYPLANGQRYNTGKLEGQMPVEECGNMILLTALAVRSDDSAAYAERHWDLLTQWADYLREKGLDPENQLCTDDFAGHLAHNTNLSLKAINAIGAYAMMAEMLGKPEAPEYGQAAREMAAQWQKMADDGDHYRLTFDGPGTWSMKYNLVWDELFGLNLFPATIAEKEVAYYLKVQNEYGLPLDNRKDYTKTDWLVWCATMANSQKDFAALVAPLYRFVNETPDRVPFTDWYDTKTAKVVGFRARPVIGGIFIKLLTDDNTWRKWRERAEEK